MEDLFCGVCKSVPKFPIILPCCLKTICKDHKSSSCAFCKSDLSTAVLQPNNVLSHYINSNISVKCDRCEENPSSLTCHNCMASLCKDCSSFLHSQGVFTKHVLSNCSQLMNNVDNLEICNVHKLPFKFFCPKDLTSLCRRCKETHNSHGPQPIETIVSDHFNHINLKQDSISKGYREVLRDISKCKDNIENIEESYENSKINVVNKIKALRQSLQWKEEELIGEIETQYKRKKMEVEYLYEGLQKNEKKLKQSLDFIEVSKKLPPNTFLTQITYITHIVDRALEIENPVLSLGKTDLGFKINTEACQAGIENISFSEDTFAINTSISNTNNQASNISSFAKSPSLRLKSVSEKSAITPIKSRSNSRESNSILNSLEENPLEARVFRKKLQSDTSIQVSWSHPSKSVSGLAYCLEYGVGTKLNNIEQFRQVYKGTAHTCIITDLLPKTSYRFRVAPSINDTKGEWSEIVTVTTFDYQKIDANSFGAHANIITRAQEKYIQFDKPGIIYGTNVYSFGKYSWEIKVLNTLYSSEGNLLRVGVSSVKSKVVHGIDMEYQAARGTVKIKVFIDIEAGTMNIVSNIGNNSENLYSLPEGPVIPAIMYKPTKNSTAPVRISVDFDM